MWFYFCFFIWNSVAIRLSLIYSVKSEGYHVELEVIFE